MTRAICSIWVTLAAAPVIADEPLLTRYDVGQRLVQLERAWEAHPDAAARARAMPVLKLAVPQFLSGKMAEAAATLDRSRLLLEIAEPTAAQVWAASLLVHPEARLVDSATESLTVRVGPAYPAGDPPAGTELSLVIVAADGTTRHRGVKLIVNKLPLNVDIPIQHIPEGDHVLRAEVSVAGKVLATYVAGVSVTPRLSERLDRLRIATDGRSTDSATLASLQLLLRDLTGRTAAETNFPATRLLAEAEDLAKSVQSGDQFYGPQRTGQFWLTIPTGTSPTYTRLFVPEQAKAGKPLPLVVALHGAGGSENLFFDAYGYGLIARLAKERGWLVVAPRAGWLFDAAPPVAAFVDELAKTYPVDKQRVYLVGHSMGAMQTVALAQQSPGRFAAIAALGGGGGLSKPAVFQNLPTFIGCGKEDFLLAGAKGLAQALERSGAKRVTFKEYPNVEHMLVVQEALPEVFKFFAGAMRE